MKTNKKPNDGRKESSHHEDVEDAFTSHKDDTKNNEKPNHGFEESDHHENVEVASPSQKNDVKNNKEEKSWTRGNFSSQECRSVFN